MKTKRDEFESVLRLINGEGAEAASTGGRPPSSSATDGDLLDAYSQAVVGVVRKVGPAVVSITPEQGERAWGGGSGSGFLITPDGYALTNSHVVSGRRRLTATTQDGDSLSAPADRG